MPRGRPRSTSLPYVQLDPHIFEHEKAGRLADLLQEHSDLPRGILRVIPVFIFAYAGRGAIDGNLGALSKYSLAEVCNWPGNPDVLMSALIDAKWLDKNEKTGEIRVHNWKKYAGSTLKSRERWQRANNKGKSGPINRAVNSRLTANKPRVNSELTRAEVEVEVEEKSITEAEETAPVKRKTKSKKAVKWRGEKQAIVGSYKMISGREKYIPTAAYPLIDRVLDEGVPVDEVIATVEYAWRNARVNDKGGREDHLQHFLSQTMFPQYYSSAMSGKAKPMEVRFEEFNSYLAAGKKGLLPEDDQEDFEDSMQQTYSKFTPFLGKWKEYHADNQGSGERLCSSGAGSAPGGSGQGPSGPMEASAAESPRPQGNLQLI